MFGPFTNCHETAESQYRLGREAEDAKNKSRYLIFVTRKLMAGAYAWRGEDYERSFHEAEAAAEMAPFDAETQSTAAYYATNAGRLDKGIEGGLPGRSRTMCKRIPLPKATSAWAYYAAGRNAEAVEVFQGSRVVTAYARRGPISRASAAWKKPGP